MRNLLQKPEQQFLVLTICILGLIGIILNTSLSSLIKDNFITSRVETISSYLNRNSSKIPPQAFSSSDYQANKPIFEEALKALADLGVVRVKVYNQKGVVVYSDEPKLIGENFSGSEELEEALKGQVETEISETVKKEHSFERGYGQLMEIYTPVFLGRKEPIGVIEAYYAIDSLNWQIKRTQIFIGGTLTLSFVALFLGLFWMFKRASKQVDLIHSRESEKLREISRLKDEFVFVAAHELRTPVTAIKAYASMVLEESKNLKGTVKSDLKMIQTANNVLLELINDLLEVARGAAGKLQVNVTSQDMKKILSYVLGQLQPLAKEKNISLNDLTPQPLPLVLADQDKLKEVFLNLLSNAIKYNHTGGKITISCKEEEDFLVVSVKDTGIGLSSEDKKHIFERFWRSENSFVRQNTGTGLGLFITKELVERMGGKIWVESEENKGSNFSFKLKTGRFKK